jgi:hypothetical protein
VKKAVVAMTFFARDGLHRTAAFIGAQTAMARSTDISARNSPEVIPPEYPMKNVNLELLLQINAKSQNNELRSFAL